MTNKNTTEKKSLRQIQKEATEIAKKQAIKEARDPALKKSMNQVRAKEAEFFASQK